MTPTRNPNIPPPPLTELDPDEAEMQGLSPGHAGRPVMNSKYGLWPRNSPRKTPTAQARSVLGYVKKTMMQPEVLLLSVWWVIMTVLVVYVANLGALMMEIWFPLACLFGIPMISFGALVFLTNDTTIE